MKNIIKKIPFINSVASFLYYKVFANAKSFSGSEEYWNNRYKKGGNSGAGSYHKLAEFKAKNLNDFVEKYQVKSVIEFGCGDGNQLKYINYPQYIGSDVSKDAIHFCRESYENDPTKRFVLLSDLTDEKAMLTLSLDVIYHLIEDQVFVSHMEKLFSSSEKYVIIYSSNTDKQYKIQAPHVKHRKFTDWVDTQSEWKLLKYIPNQYPYNIDESKGSFADFYIFEKQ